MFGRVRRLEKRVAYLEQRLGYQDAIKGNLGLVSLSKGIDSTGLQVILDDKVIGEITSIALVPLEYLKDDECLIFNAGEKPRCLPLSIHSWEEYDALLNMIDNCKVQLIENYYPGLRKFRK